LELIIYGRNVGIKVRDIFSGLLIDFFQGSDVAIKFLVTSVDHWGVNEASGCAQKRGY